MRKVILLLLSLLVLLVTGCGSYQKKTKEKLTAMSTEEVARLAEMEDTDAECEAGIRLYNDMGEKRDCKKAVEYFRKAAIKGSARATRCLGICYLQGNGVEKNYYHSKEWLEKAADMGDREAQYLMGLLPRFIKEFGDTLESIKWLMMSAEQGHKLAQYALGCEYKLGRILEINDTLAFKWLSKSAEQGYNSAQLSVGLAYCHGAGVQRNDTVAYMWIRKAAEQGNTNAQEILSDMYLEGIGVEKNEIKAQKWLELSKEDKSTDFSFIDSYWE